VANLEEWKLSDIKTTGYAKTDSDPMLNGLRWNFRWRLIFVGAMRLPPTA
jgi:hypothetical protein